MLVIQPHKTKTDDLKELWKYRQLIFFLTWRDLIVRYKQTVVGFLWHFLKPLLMLMTLTFVFGKLAHLNQNKSYPYSLLVITGLLPWQFFSSSLIDCSESLVANYQLITKIYFPRIILPISCLFITFIDFLMTFTILGILFLFHAILPPLNVIFLPCFIGLLFLLSFSLGIWSAALNVKYRDCRQLVPFAIQFGLYITPVGFSSSIVPSEWKIFYYLNPLAGIIDGFRWCLLGRDEIIYAPGLLLSITVIFLLFYCGFTYYRSIEKVFADII